MRSRLLVALTVGMLAVGGGSAIAAFLHSGGGLDGFFEDQNASFYQFHPPCKQDDEFFNDSTCDLAPPGHYWHFIHGWSWIPNASGGFTWGYGNGWLFE